MNLSTTVLFLTVLLLVGPVSAQKKAGKSKKKEYFFLTDQALGNSKSIKVVNRDDITLRVEAVGQNQGHHNHKVAVSVFIDCDGDGKAWPEKRVSASHPSLAHIEYKKDDKMILCGLYNADIDPVNVHLIVYEKTLSGECQKDGKGQFQSEDIVIPLFGEPKKQGEIQGFCQKK